MLHIIVVGRIGLLLKQESRENVESGSIHPHPRHNP